VNTVKSLFGGSIRMHPKSASGRLTAIAAGVALAALACPAARADDADLSALKQQLQRLQQEVNDLEAREAKNAAAAAAATPAAPAAAAPAKAPSAGNAPVFYAGPLKVTLGGFVEMMVVNRSKNEAADWASNYNTAIPYPQSPNAGLSEFHLTERQSRFAALVQGPTDPDVAAEAYLEGDFGGGPRTGNNNESTSFSPRVRHFYADYQRKDQGWYLLFGQAWSLMTQNKKGIVPRQELIPLTIDGQYVPGFTWDRTPQIRLVKNFGEVAAVGLSIENPAALLAPNSGCGTVGTAGNTLATPVCNTPGGSGFDANNNFTLDARPDVILKAAFDPGWGHYEIFGIDRGFRDRVNGSSNTTKADSFGGSFLVPLVANRLDFMASALTGKGVGRYGSAQLPDMTLRPDGTLEAMQGYEFLAGLTFKATPDLTLYAYGGQEHVDKAVFTSVVAGKLVYSGYGNPTASNANCLIEGSSGACTANTSSVTQGTIGGWWKFYKGALGNMQAGAQFTNVRRDIYGGVGGAPSTNINIGLVSLRYYPYQN